MWQIYQVRGRQKEKDTYSSLQKQRERERKREAMHAEKVAQNHECYVQSYKFMHADNKKKAHGCILYASESNT